MSAIAVDANALLQFELGLDPHAPERSAIPARVLGYGEMSTVMMIGDGADGLAYKRMPMFRDVAEAEAYTALYHEYMGVLRDGAGIPAVPGEMVTINPGQTGYTVNYLVQPRLPAEVIAPQTLAHLSPADVHRLFVALLKAIDCVFDYNERHRGQVEIGFDGQLSNWGVVGFDPTAGGLPEPLELIYFDTSSPLLRRQRQEQLDPELFLRSAPSFLVWIIRLLFLEDVMTRYYDRRLVVIDLLANLYKEQHPELVPPLVTATHHHFAAAIQEGTFEPITVGEVRRYYREDAWIWRLYLGLRRLDRRWHRLRGRPYPYVLPGPIRR